MEEREVYRRGAGRQWLLTEITKAKAPVRAECPPISEMEFESKLEDALRESTRSDQLPVWIGVDVRPGEHGGAVRRSERIARVHGHRRRLIYAGHIDDVEEVGELADDLDAHRLTDRNETRVTQIDLLDVATRRGIAADEKRP